MATNKVAIWIRERLEVFLRIFAVGMLPNLSISFGSELSTTYRRSGRSDNPDLRLIGNQGTVGLLAPT